MGCHTYNFTLLVFWVMTPCAARHKSIISEGEGPVNFEAWVRPSVCMHKKDHKLRDLLGHITYVKFTGPCIILIVE